MKAIRIAFFGFAIAIDLAILRRKALPAVCDPPNQPGLLSALMWAATQPVDGTTNPAVLYAYLARDSYEFKITDEERLGYKSQPEAALAPKDIR